jgi:hypothetical protein
VSKTLPHLYEDVESVHVRVHEGLALAIVFLRELEEVRRGFREDLGVGSRAGETCDVTVLEFLELGVSGIDDAQVDTPDAVVECWIERLLVERSYGKGEGLGDTRVSVAVDELRYVERSERGLGLLCLVGVGLIVAWWWLRCLKIRKYQMRVPLTP